MAKLSLARRDPGNRPAEDPDRDGLTNFLEFLFGQDPLRAGTASLRTGLMEESGERYLTIEADLLPVAGVTVSAECGDDPGWESGTSGVPVGTPELLPDGRLRHRWRDTVPVGRQVRRFMRIRAVSP